VELIEWRLISTQLIPNQPSALHRAANAREPIPHVSEEYGCAIGAMVSTFIDAGVFAIVVMASLPLLMRRCLCRRLVIVVAPIACRKAGVVALVVMASLPLMHRRLHHCCNGD
jgi:hypothetical protein